MAIDLFDTRTLLQAVEQLKPARRFLINKFFTNVRTFETEAVDVDIVKGARRLAPFVHPRIGSQTVDSLGYETKTFTPPQVAPDGNFTGQDLQKRLPGENIYSGSNPNARLASLIGTRLAEYDEMISRREEWMASKAMFTGQIPIVGKGYNTTIDFLVDNKETLTTKAKWSYVADDRDSEHPIAFLKRMKRTTLKKSGVGADTCVMAPDSADAFMQHPDVIEYFNTRQNINMGVMQPREEEPGVYFICHINELNLDVYSYEEYYIDPVDGEEKPLVPSGTVMMTSSSVNFQMLYGCVIDVEIGSFALPRVPKSWVEHKPSARVLQLISRPLPAIVLPDAMFIATVL
jgi:hypothetical protein